MISLLELIDAKKLYRVLVLIAAAGILAFFFNFELGDIAWQQLSLFIILLMISNVSRTQLPSGINFSVGFIMEMAIIQIFDVNLAVMTVAASALLVNGFGLIIGNRGTFADALFNTAISVITLGGTALGFLSFQEPIIGFVAATLVYFGINVTLVTLANYTDTGEENFRGQWLETGKEISLNFFVLAPLAYLIAYVFSTVESQNKLFFVLLFFVPIMLVNYAYRLYTNIRQSYLNTVRTMIAAHEAKDPYVKGHAERVANHALAIARDMGYSDKELTRLQYIALLHDAGKIGIRDYILNKPGSLTAEEFGSVKEHSVIGEQIISKIQFLSKGADIVRYHHERFDGTGYPEGLKGYDIPEGARILAVVDAFDAMTTDRPYRKAKTKLAALAEIDALAGTHFDPKIVEMFKKILFRQGEI